MGHSTTPTKPMFDDRFGLCPECHQTSGYINDGPNHYFTCETHKLKWCPASNLFSDWKYEDEAQQQRNRETLAGMTDCEPFYHEGTCQPSGEAF